MFKDDTGGKFKNCQEQIEKRASKGELNELEQRVNEKINELVNKLMGQFADKGDTRKRLSNIEKNVNHKLHPL